MSLTIAGVGDNKYDIYGSTPAGMFDITYDNSYPAAGYAVTAGNFGLSRPIAGILFLGVNTAAFVNQFVYNNATAKIMILKVGATTAAFVDSSAAADFSTFITRVLVFCRR